MFPYLNGCVLQESDRFSRFFIHVIVTNSLLYRYNLKEAGDVTLFEPANILTLNINLFDCKITTQTD